MSRLAIKPLALSTHIQIQRTTGLLLTAALQETEHLAAGSQEAFRRNSASSEFECWSIRSCCTCRISGRTAIPPVHRKSMGPVRSWKTEELCFSQEKGWPTVPQTSPFHPQRGCRALPKGFPSRMCPFAQMPHPQQIKPNADGEVSTLMVGVFFSGTHNPQFN